MSEEHKNPQATSEKSTDKVQAAKETAKNIAGTVVNKADALYNKLPLGKINEILAKMPGKFDAKSRGFKVGVAIVAILVILFGLKIALKKNPKTAELQSVTNVLPNGIVVNKVMTPEMEQEAVNTFNLMQEQMRQAQAQLDKSQEELKQSLKKAEEERVQANERMKQEMEEERARLAAQFAAEKAADAAKQKAEQERQDQERQIRLARQDEERKAREAREAAEEAARIEQRQATRKALLAQLQTHATQNPYEVTAEADTNYTCKLASVKPYHSQIIKLVETPQEFVLKFLNDYLIDAEDDKDIFCLQDDGIFMRQDRRKGEQQPFNGFFLLGDEVLTSEKLNIYGPSLFQLKDGVIEGMKINFDHSMKRIASIAYYENGKCLAKELFNQRGLRESTNLIFEGKNEKYEVTYKYVRGKPEIEEAKGERKDEFSYSIHGTGETIINPNKKIHYSYKNGLIQSATEEYIATINNHQYKKRDKYSYDDNGILEGFYDIVYVNGMNESLTKISYYPNGNMKTRMSHNKLEGFYEDGKLAYVREPQISTSYYPNGKIKSEVGELQAKPFFKYYDEQGVLIFFEDDNGFKYEQGGIKYEGVGGGTCDATKYYEKGFLLFDGIGRDSASYRGKFYYENGSIARDGDNLFDENGNPSKGLKMLSSPQRYSNGLKDRMYKIAMIITKWHQDSPKPIAWGLKNYLDPNKL